MAQTKSELMEDFARLRDPATEIANVLDTLTKGPADAVMVLAMVSAYMISMHRKHGTSLEDAQKPFFNIVKLLSAMGEEGEGTTH